MSGDIDVSNWHISLDTMYSTTMFLKEGSTIFLFIISANTKNYRRIEQK